jgi:hypothetical protein
MTWNRIGRNLCGENLSIGRHQNRNPQESLQWESLHRKHQNQMESDLQEFLQGESLHRKHQNRILKNLCDSDSQSSDSSNDASDEENLPWGFRRIPILMLPMERFSPRRFLPIRLRSARRFFRRCKHRIQTFLATIKRRRSMFGSARISAGRIGVWKNLPRHDDLISLTTVISLNAWSI